VALWKGKEQKHFDQYCQDSDLVAQLCEFVPQYGSVLIVSDWQGLRAVTQNATPNTVNMEAECCCCCDISKREMKALGSVGYTKLRENDVLKDCLSVYDRCPCVFHGARVLTSWAWHATLCLVKSWGRGIATQAVDKLNSQFPGEDYRMGKYVNYLSFDNFQAFLTTQAYLFALEPLVEHTSKVHFTNPITKAKTVIAVVDLLHQFWKAISAVVLTSFEHTPDVVKFEQNCSLIRAIGQKFEMDCTVWPHWFCVHAPDYMKKHGSLAQMDNRACEQKHKETTVHIEHSTHGQIHPQTGRVGYAYALGKDNILLHKELNAAYD